MSKTFLDIAGITHNENAWSDIYAYFFDPKNPHCLGMTFLNCLISLIKEKDNHTHRFDLPESACNVNVYREVTTEEDGRIDLLIFADDNAIIIENKVYHNLLNDLDDYMQSVKEYDNKRVGVILTLNPIHVSNDRYVNITHRELLDKVDNSIANMIIDDFNNTILSQFTNVVRNMSGLSQDNQTRFLNKRSEILENARLLDDVKEWYFHVFNDKEFIETLKNNVKKEDSKDSIIQGQIERQTKKYRYIQFKVTDLIAFNILFEPLWNSDYEIHYFPPKHQSLFLTLEISNLLKVKKSYPDIENKINQIIEPSGIKYVSSESRNWWHFACVEIPIKDNELFDNQFLTDEILNAATDLFNKLKSTELFNLKTGYC
ncbi:MAG: PD-(D/E)XK nuclease family protein [Bacteroides sp.]|nr:PD-(D/E)XK nuclease family protein [Bacteroides sp.]